MANQRILVAGAAGFIGHHLVRRLKRDGYWVRGVDSKNPRYEQTPADEFELLDLRRWDHLVELVSALAGKRFIRCHNSDFR